MLFCSPFASCLATFVLPPKNVPTCDQNPPKMEPKPCPNPVQNASKFDIMLQTLKIESEQTLPHFSSFLLFPNLQKPAYNQPKTDLKFRPIWDSLLEAQKTGLLTFFLSRFGSQLGPKLGLCWLRSQLRWAPILALRQHDWPRRIQTYKPCQHEADFGSNSSKFRLTGSKFSSDFGSCRATTTQRVRRNSHRATSQSSCNDTQLLVVAVLCCLKTSSMWKTWHISHLAAVAGINKTEVPVR